MNPDAIERSMFDVLVHRLPITEIIHKAEVDVAVSSIDLAGAELALSAMIGRERALEKALVEVRGVYDFILVDTPPSLGLLTINAFVAATGVIVPVQCEYLSLRGLVQLENTLAMVRENLNPDVRIEGILPTMFDRRTLHSREAVEILEENFGDLVFKTRIRKTVRYAEAPVKGVIRAEVRPVGCGRRGLPRAGEGGARWRETARACVRARWPSSSARPRPPSGRPSRRAEQPTEQQRAAREPSSRRRRRQPAPPEEPQEMTVEHVPDFAAGGGRGDDGALPPPTTDAQPRASPSPPPRRAEPQRERALRAACRLATRRCPSPRRGSSTRVRATRRRTSR